MKLNAKESLFSYREWAFFVVRPAGGIHLEVEVLYGP